MLNSKKDTIQIIQIQAIINFWLACQNIQKFDLIEMAFKGTESDPMIVHLFKLFDSVKFNVFDFIGKLDTKKRGVFINHIMTHYNGISIDTVKEQYMANVKLSEPEPKAWSVVLEGSNDYLAKHHRTALINRFSKWDWSVRMKGTEVCIEHIKAEIFFKITAITSSTVYLKFERINHIQTAENDYCQTQARMMLLQGKKMTHKYFVYDEFISIENGQLVDEKGLVLNQHDFWSRRDSENWQTGWTEYKTPTHEQ